MGRTFIEEAGRRVDLVQDYKLKPCSRSRHPLTILSLGWCNQAWVLKNSFGSLIRVKSGDQKCLEIREDRL
jgi:hypothetical protein